MKSKEKMRDEGRACNHGKMGTLTRVAFDPIQEQDSYKYHTMKLLTFSI